MSQNKLIHEFRKSTSQKIVCQFTEFKNRRLIDLRLFYYAGKNGEDWQPTKKGLTLRRDLIPELKLAVDKALAAWERELPGGPGDNERIREGG
jgi:hypothetical protein